MRIGDFVYFAPDLRFAQVDLNSPKLPQQFERRISGYFLDPSDECSDRGHAFAAGLLLVSCIDALARLRFGGDVGRRFRQFVREELSSFKKDELARRFYEEFRNGLVHEARIKRGGQFSLDQNETVEQRDGLLLVNPKLLGRELRDALTRYVGVLATDGVARAKFATRLSSEFSEEFAGVGLRGAT